MLSAFAWYANYHFIVNSGGISKNEFFSKNLSKFPYYFGYDNFLV